jgi:hypothetical protein
LPTLLNPDAVRDRQITLADTGTTAGSRGSVGMDNAGTMDPATTASTIADSGLGIALTVTVIGIRDGEVHLLLVTEDNKESKEDDTVVVQGGLGKRVRLATDQLDRVTKDERTAQEGGLVAAVHDGLGTNTRIERLAEAGLEEEEVRRRMDTRHTGMERPSTRTGGDPAISSSSKANKRDGLSAANRATKPLLDLPSGLHHEDQDTETRRDEQSRVA